MTTTDRRPILAVLTLGLALIATACSAAAPSSPAGSASPPATTPSAAPSAGTGGGMVDATGDWRLTSGTNAGAAIPIVPDSDITMTVAGTQVSGRSACNSYGGEVIVKDGVVQFGPLMSTEMACPDPIMASEAAYLAALAGVRAAALDGDTLTLSGPGVELVYERVVPAPSAS
jgi:heat shock protein HslJ